MCKILLFFIKTQKFKYHQYYLLYFNNHHALRLCIFFKIHFYEKKYAPILRHFDQDQLQLSKLGFRLFLLQWSYTISYTVTPKLKKDNYKV